MAFLVAHAEKYSIGACAGLGIHVDRKSEEHSNKNINNTLSSENVELVENYNNNLYGAVKDRIKEGYTGKKAIRKDAVATIGIVCSASSDFFENKSKSETVQYFKDCKEYFENKVGKENIVCSKIHFDEKTPHMHLYFVPLTEDGRLSAKEICNRQFLRDMQKELPIFLQEKKHKIERGLEDSTNEHISKKEYELNLKKEEIEKVNRELLERKQKLSDEEKKIEEKKKSLTSENEKLYNLNNVLNHVEEKKKFFKDEVIVSMDKEIYKSLVKYAREGEKYLRKTIELQEKIEKLEQENSNYFLRNKNLSDRNMLLETKKIDLQLELQKYKAIGNVLQELGYEKALEECLLYSAWKSGNWKEKDEIKKNLLGKDEEKLNRAERKILKTLENNISWEKKVVKGWKNKEKDMELER